MQEGRGKKSYQRPHSVEGQGSTFHFCIRFGISIPLNTELVEEKQDVLKVTSPTASIRASTNDQNNRAVTIDTKAPKLTAHILDVDGMLT